MADHGEEGLAHATGQAFDIILSDMPLLVMDGPDMKRAIRVHEAWTGAGVPIVGVTVHDLQSDCDRCLESGMDA